MSAVLVVGSCDGEQGGGFGLFGEGLVFAIHHDADDLSGRSGAVFKEASDDVVALKQAAGELLVHDGNERSFDCVAEADIAPGEQRCCGAG